MPRRRDTFRPRRHTGHLPEHVRDHLDYGYSRTPISDDELRDAWAEHGEQIMQEHAEQRRDSWPSRPWAWWLYDKGETPPRVFDPPWREAERLLELGELSGRELAALKACIRAKLPAIDNPHVVTPDERPVLVALAERLNIEPDAEPAEPELAE